MSSDIEIQAIITLFNGLVVYMAGDRDFDLGEFSELVIKLTDYAEKRRGISIPLNVKNHFYTNEQN